MVGIITFHCQYNYGSALQAWALQTVIQSMGQTCKLLNYYYDKDMKTYDIRWYSKRPAVIAFDLLTAPAMQIRKHAFHTFHHLYFVQTKRTKNWQDLTALSEDCDILVCGSDQIWNYAITEGLHPAYFLDFARPSQRKVAYAPSLNQFSIEQHMQTLLINKLKNYDNISVREESTAQQLSEVLGFHVPAVLDPTLLLQPEDYAAMTKACPFDFPKKYIFVYCLHHNHLSFFCRYAENYAQEHNAKIVYCNKFSIRKAPYEKNIFQFGPEAFLAAIQHAEFVLSDSFHACSFAIIFKKDFAVYAPDGCPSRMQTLFCNLGIHDRFITNISQILPPILYEDVISCLQYQQQVSLKYLKNALE